MFAQPDSVSARWRLVAAKTTHTGIVCSAAKLFGWSSTAVSQTNQLAPPSVQQTRLEQQQNLTLLAVVRSERVPCDWHAILHSPACFGITACWLSSQVNIANASRRAQLAKRLRIIMCDDVDVCRSPGTLPCCMLRMVSESTLSTQAMFSQMCMVRTLPP